MKEKKVALVVAMCAAFVPGVILAAGPQAGFGQVGMLITTFVDFIDSYLVPLVFALAFFMFLWGMFKFFFVTAASEEGRDSGKQLMLWAVIAFVIMVSIWGLVNVVAAGLGFDGQNAPPLPTVPGGGGGTAGGGGMSPSSLGGLY